MRIWDISPGYLARQQLLGEHRELHGLVNILEQGKRGYARHPETRRWAAHLPALRQRHQELVAEMALRGYRHHTPLPWSGAPAAWPGFIDPPHRQLALLRRKYADGRTGRMPLPADTRALWAQHKYSVLAREPALYAEIGPAVAHGPFEGDMQGLATLLVATLHRAPPPGRLANALQHMWGHVADGAEAPAPAEPAALLAAIRHEAARQHNDYLLHATALSELALWL